MLKYEYFWGENLRHWVLRGWSPLYTIPLVDNINFTLLNIRQNVREPSVDLIIHHGMIHSFETAARRINPLFILFFQIHERKRNFS